MTKACQFETDAVRARSCELDVDIGNAARAAPPLRRSIAWSFVGTMVYSACQMGLIVLFARCGTATIVGQFAFAMAVTTPIVLFTNCALRTIQASDTTDDVGFGSYLAFRLIGLAVAATLIVGVALCCEPAERNVTLAIGMAKCFESLADLIHGAMQRRERMDLLGQSQLLRGCGGLIVVAGVFVWTHDVAISCWALAATFAAVVFLYDLPMGAAICKTSSQPPWQAIRSWFRPCWHQEQLRELTKLALPLGLTVVTGALIANVCRYFLYCFRGTEELGIFAALSWFALAGTLVATALAHAALPRLSQYYAAADRLQFERLFRFLLVSGAVAGVGGIGICAVGGSTILAGLYGPEYADHATAFTILAVSIAFSMEICYLDHALYAARRFRVQVPVNLIVGALMLIGCYAVIPSAGIVGAAWVTCVAAAVQMLVRLLIVWRIVHGMGRCEHPSVAHSASDTKPQPVVT